MCWSLSNFSAVAAKVNSGFRCNAQHGYLFISPSIQLSYDVYMKLHLPFLISFHVPVYMWSLSFPISALCVYVSTSLLTYLAMHLLAHVAVYLPCHLPIYLYPPIYLCVHLHINLSDKDPPRPHQTHPRAPKTDVWMDLGSPNRTPTWSPNGFEQHMCTYVYMQPCRCVCLHIHTHLYIYTYM